MYIRMLVLQFSVIQDINHVDVVHVSHANDLLILINTIDITLIMIKY